MTTASQRAAGLATQRIPPPSTRSAARLKRRVQDDAHFILRSERVRIVMCPGLMRGGIDQTCLSRLKQQHLDLSARERRGEVEIPDPRTPRESEDAAERVGAMHSSTFDIGVRTWALEQPTPEDLELRVAAFIHGTPGAPRGLRAPLVAAR